MVHIHKAAPVHRIFKLKSYTSKSRILTIYVVYNTYDDNVYRATTIYNTLLYGNYNIAK